MQTVAESLATKCNGQAWIIVTAQEDMSSVVGETSKQQSNDFTKIQARFKIEMKLTSQDVAEVIQLRLLEKREEYIEQLSDLFHQQENNFKTLFDFADGSATYRNYRDREHFIQCYPFCALSVHPCSSQLYKINPPIVHLKESIVRWVSVLCLVFSSKLPSRLKVTI